MAIVMINLQSECNNIITGAYSPLDAEPSTVYCYEEFKGCCIKEFERNSRDDSDFYMVVWNENKQQPETVLFATTRCWSYPCYGSKVDATDEVIEKYNNYMNALQTKRDKQAKIEKLQKQRKINAEERKIARKLNVDVKRLRLLTPLYDSEVFNSICTLISSNPRSEFRKSLKSIVISWLEGKSSYEKPLSYKQVQYL